MSLDLPTVSVTLGPAWATALNAALTAIDLHDHSEGKGTRITSAGININDDLDFADFYLTSVGSLRMTSLGAALASSEDINCFYVVNGNLYFNNNAGVGVQVTSGSSVNAPGSGEWDTTTPGAYPYTVVTGDAQRVILVDTGSARTINLPAATTVMFCIIKDKTGTCQTNNITVTPDGTDSIDGATGNLLIRSNFASVGFISDGVSAWYQV